MSLSQKYYLQGKQYIEKERYDKAEDSFKKLIELNPIFVDAYNQLGNVYYQQQNFQEAEIWYKKAIKINPKISDFYNNLGNVYSDDKQYQKAVGQYQKAMKLNETDPDIHNNLANAYYNCQQYLKAINQFKIAINLNPHDPDYKTNLNCIYTNIIKKQYPDRFDENWTFNQNSFQGHIFLARYYQNNGAAQKAAQQYQAVVRLNPDSEPHYYELIEIYEYLKMYDKIISLYNIIPLEFQGKFINIKKNAVKQKKIQEFESSIKNFPEDPKKYYQFGKILLKQAQPGEVIEIFKKAEFFYENYGVIDQLQSFNKKIDNFQQNQIQKQSMITKSQSQIVINYEKITEYLSCELNLFDIYLKNRYLDIQSLAQIMQKFRFLSCFNSKNEKVEFLNKIGIDQTNTKKLDYFCSSFQLIKQKQRQMLEKYQNISHLVQEFMRQPYYILADYNMKDFFENKIFQKKEQKKQEFEKSNHQNIELPKIKNKLYQKQPLKQKNIEQIKVQIELKLSQIQRKLVLQYAQYMNSLENMDHQRKQRKQNYQSNQRLQESYRQEQNQLFHHMKPRQREVRQINSIKARRVNNIPKKQQNQMKLKKKLKSKQTKFSLSQIQQIYSKIIQNQYKKDKQQLSDELYSLKNKLQEYQNCFDKNQLLTNRLNELQKSNKKKISNYGKKLYSFLVSIIQAYRMLDTNMLQKGEGLHEASGMVSKLLNYAEMLPVIGEVTSITKQITGLYWQKQDEIRSKTIVTNLSYFWNQKLMSDAVSEIVNLLINQEKYCIQIQEYQQEESGDIFEIFQGKKEEVVKIFTSVQKKQEENQQKLAIIDSSYILLGLAEIKQEQIQQFKKKNPQTQNILIIQVQKLIQFRKGQKQKQIKQQNQSQNSNIANVQVITSNKAQKEIKKPLKNLKYSIVFIVLIVLSLIFTYGPSYWQQFSSFQYQGNFNKLYDCFNQSPQHQIALNILGKSQYTVVYGYLQDGLLNFIQHFSNQEIKRQKNVLIQQFYMNENGMIEFSQELQYDLEKSEQQSQSFHETTWLFISWTVSRIPKQAVLKVIANNPQDKVIIILPQDENNEKISKQIKYPKFKIIDLPPIDQNYVKESIQRNYKFDENEAEVLYEHYGDSKTTFQAFENCQKCTHQGLVGEDYQQLSQFSRKDKRVLKSLCKLGKVQLDNISQDLINFGLIGQNGQIYWKNENSMLNYMLHKNSICNKQGIYKIKEQQTSSKKQTQIKMFKMKIKRSEGSQVFQVSQQKKQQLGMKHLQ